MNEPVVKSASQYDASNSNMRNGHPRLEQRSTNSGRNPLGNAHGF